MYHYYSLLASISTYLRINTLAVKSCRRKWQYLAMGTNEHRIDRSLQAGESLCVKNDNHRFACDRRPAFIYLTLTCFDG
jgi:hypothetical protein